MASVWSNGWLASGAGRSFAAVGFGTATSERDSACMVGVAAFEDGAQVDEIELLVRPPQNRYDPPNTALLGIGPADTEHSPVLPDVWPKAAEMIGERLVVAHNAAFVMSVLRRSARRHGYEPAPFWFACTYRVARSAVPDAASWSLDAMAEQFELEAGVGGRGALSQARAAGLLWMALAERSGASHPKLLFRLGYKLGYCHAHNSEPFSNTSRSSSSKRPYRAEDFVARCVPGPGGPLVAKRVVFTGSLGSMPRREAFQAAVDAGAVPSHSVSGRTDYLVVGTTEMDRVGESGRNHQAPTSAGVGRAGCQHRDHRRGPVRRPARRRCLRAGRLTRQTRLGGRSDTSADVWEHHGRAPLRSGLWRLPTNRRRVRSRRPAAMR